jgi:site-specific DNA-methyltransferase (adenine-specific)
MLQVREVELSRLKPWESNPRINDLVVDSVVRSIRAFGFNVPILCDQNLTIIAGHTRWKAAKELGLKAVPVIVLKMSDTQRQAFSIADNKTAEIANWDFPKLREILEELSSEDIALENLGFSDEELRRFLGDAGEDEDELPEVEGEPQTKKGDLIVLGPHRLLCGDSKDARMVRCFDTRRENRSCVWRAALFQPARLCSLG